MTKRKYSDEELISRVWDGMEIKNLVGRHAYGHAYDMHEKELKEYWVQEPENRKTASFGQNWGYQVGMDVIWKNYVDLNTTMRQDDLDALCAADSSIENTPANHAIGSMLMHTLTTPYVEVAGDGKTAQGMWYSPGVIANATPDGVESLWMYEKYAVDFIREKDGWKIWHMFVGTDFCVAPGEDMAKQPVSKEPVPEYCPMEMDITIPMDYGYTSRYNWQEYPPIPNPYETFSETVSYGPDGHPLLVKGGK